MPDAATQPKTKTGRPRKPTAEAPETPIIPVAPALTPPSSLPFPVYPRPKHKDGTVPHAEALAYWKALAPEFIARCVVYINREWPVLNHLQLLSLEDQQAVRDKRKKPPRKYIDKLGEPFASDDWRMEFLMRYGSGDYKMYVNDIGVKGAKDDPNLESRNLMISAVSFRDPDFPPVLDPYREDKGLSLLDLKDPKNQAYIGDLRMKGVNIPGLKDPQEDMNNDSMKTLADTVGALANKTGLLEQDALVNRIAEKIGTPKTETSSFEMFLAGMKEAREATPKPAPATENSLLNTITALMLKQVDQQGEIMKQQLAAKDQEAKDMREEMRQLRAKPADGNGLSAIKELFTEVKSFLPVLKDTFPGATELVGGGLSVRGRGRAPWWETLLESPAVAEIAKPLAQAAGAAIVQSFQNRPGVQRLPDQPQPQPAQLVNGTVQQPGPQPQQQRAANILDFVFINRFPLLKHFAFWCDTNDEAWSGQGLAQWLNDGFGPTWEGINWHIELKTAGAQNLILGCQQHQVLKPEIWDKVASRADQFRQFLEDFVAWEPEPEQANLMEDQGITDLTQ